MRQRIFLFILKSLGCSVVGLDTDEFPLIVWTITAFQRLPDFGQTFHWITAFSVKFNLYRASQPRWGPAEWDFLLRDLEQYLAPGKIFFALNPHDYDAPERRDFFKPGAQPFSANESLSRMACISCLRHPSRYRAKSLPPRSTDNSHTF
jgi:hypothetical protein